MAGDFGFDGMLKVSFVTTLATPSAPTAAALTAGTPLESRLTADGLAIGIETASIDTSKLNSTANSQTIGRDSYTLSVKYVRGDQPEATAVQTALVRGAVGYLCVRRDKLSTVAWTVADKVEVYPIVVGRPSPDSPAANALQTVNVPLMVTDGNGVRGVDNPATVA